MRTSKLFILVAGIAIGHLSGYFLSFDKGLDQKQLSETIRSELSILLQQPISRPSNNQSSPPLSDNSMNMLDRARFMQQLTSNIREIVKTELKQQFSANQTTNNIKVTDSATRQNALSSIDTILNDAITRGNWSINDAEQYDSALQALTPNDMAEAYRRLSVAINNGDIKPDINSMIR